MALEKASYNLLSALPVKDAIICAENILDRRPISQKCSVIFISKSLNQPELAKRFVDRTEDFIELYKNFDEGRSRMALERLEAIKLMLKLG